MGSLNQSTGSVDQTSPEVQLLLRQPPTPQWSNLFETLEYTTGESYTVSMEQTLIFLITQHRGSELYNCNTWSTVPV